MADKPSLVLLHRSIGGDSLAGVVPALASKFSVAAPSLPGYDGSERPEWARSPRDLAAIVAGGLRSNGSQRPILVGAGLGGWVAAEIAAASPEQLRALVLVGPLGVQPLVGEITDPLLVSTEHYVEMGFAQTEAHDRAFEACELGSEQWKRREANREMTTRIAFKPRMFDATLPYRLAYMTTPTLVVWGEQDQILPRGGVDRYMASIPGAELATLPECGHMLELEEPAKLCELIAAFVARHD